MAAKTNNIHIGSGIFNITPPVNHPARIAERVAMLDHLSEGRFEFGTGRGSSTTEQKGFGINDPDLTREMVAETLPQIVRMWKDEDYSYEGKFFSHADRATSCPSPTRSRTRPSGWRRAARPPSTWPPSWVSASSASASRRRTSSRRWSLATRRRSQDCTNPVGGFVNNNVMITTQMICMEDGAKARKTFLEADSNYHLSLVFRYLDTFPKPAGIPEWPEIIPAMDAATLDAAIAAGVIGRRRPRRGRQGHRELRRHRRRPAGLRDAVDLHAASSLCEEAVETFGKHVLKDFDKDPEHLTTKQRLAAGGK